MSRIVVPALLLVSSALTMLSLGTRAVDGGGLDTLGTVLFWAAFLVFACAAVLTAKAVVAASAERADEPH
ncbi:hypothetical protein ACL90Y_04525 [Micrococcus luteus]